MWNYKIFNLLNCETKTRKKTLKNVLSVKLLYWELTSNLNTYLWNYRVEKKQKYNIN